MRGSLECCACSRSCLQDSTCSTPHRRAAAKERESGYDPAWAILVLRSKGSGGGSQCRQRQSAFGAARSAMAIVDGNLVLCLPACAMALKAKGCPECQYCSCMALAERTVRLVRHGKITSTRHAEMKKDLEQTCPLASAYHDWLLTNAEHLRIPASSFKRSRRERKDSVFEWLRQAATQSTSG